MPVSVASAFGAGLGAIAVGLLLLLSLCGWGRLAGQVLSAESRFDPGTLASLGLGVFLAGSGVLEMLQWARPAVFVAFAAVGLTWTALAAWRSPPHRPGFGPVVAGILVLLLAQLAYLVDVSWWRFDSLDDLQGYLVMPERILQSGSTGRDPFLFRRIEAGLGGGAYLYALFLTFIDFTHLRVADLGLGSMVLSLAVGSHACETPRGLRMMPVAVAAGLVTILFMPIANLAPDAVAMAVLYCALRMAWGLARADTVHLGRHLLLALLLFTLVCLRSTYIVPATAVFVALYGSMMFALPRAAALRGSITAGLLILALAAPWMVAVDAIAGTPLYPFFGYGTLSHDEMAGHAAIAVFLKLFALVLGCYVLAAGGVLSIAASRAVQGRERRFLIAIPVVMLAFLCVSDFKFTVYAFRYSYVGIVTLPLFLFTESLHYEAANPSWRASRVAVLGALGLFVLTLVRHWPDAFSNGALSAWAGQRTLTALVPVNASDPVQLSELRRNLRAMQAAVPPGQVILVRLDAPFLLDFSRNPIWVMDHPGQMGPAPGVPAEATVAAWTSYLRSVGVGFVAYSYGDEAGDSVALGQAFMKSLAAPSYWQERLEEKVGLIHTMLLELPGDFGASMVVFDDGQRFVVALTASTDKAVMAR